MQLKKTTVPALLDLVTASTYENTMVVKHYGGMTLQKALTSNAPSVSRLSNEKGSEIVSQAISKIFVATSMYFEGVLPDFKADLISEEIFSTYEYRSLKFEDLIALSVELKHTKTFGKLTLNKIITALREYVDRREKQAILNSIKQTQDAKSCLGENNIDKRIHNSIRQIDDSNKLVVKGRIRTKKYYS